MLERLPRARGGLKLLGGAVQGALEVDIMVDEIGLQPALKRARRAAQLADRIREFATAAPVPQTAHLAWLLLSKCVNHALSFDAPMVGEDALTTANGIVENALWPAMHAILSVDVTGAARRRMRISGAFGGCGLRAEASGAYAHAAHYAAWLSKASRVVAIASFMGKPVPRCHGGPEAAKAQEGLRRAGVVAASDGAVGLAKDAATSAWQKDQPINELGRLKVEEKVIAPQTTPQGAPARLPRRLVSRMYKHLDAIEVAALWHGAELVTKEVMLSSGGAGAGGLWVAMPYRSTDFFDTAHFRCATLLRLGEVKPPHAATCKILKRAVHGEEGHEDPGTQARECGHVLGLRGEHALLCKAGPARMRPHRHLAAVLCREMRAIGAEVDMERVVPELIDRRPQTPAEKRDAVLDLVVSFPGAFAQSRVDVSIRCPHADRYGRADHVPGEAAAKAADEKHERYGPFVLPLAFGSYGRLGNAGRRTLEILAAHAGACAKDHWAVQRLVPRWSSALERAVTFSTAEVVLLSLGGRVGGTFGM